MSVEALLANYAEGHRHPINQALQWVCAPLLYFSVFALLWAIPNLAWLEAVRLNFAIIALAAAQAWYFSQAPRLGFGMLVLHALLIVLTSWLSLTLLFPLWLFAAAIFLLASIGLVAGDRIEGGGRSLLNGLRFVLVGPLWLLGLLYSKLGWRH